jgi:putative phage-type endonuclease
MIDLELRRKCITSTDVGPIFGVDGFRDAFEVWAEKHGHAPPWIPNARAAMGKDLEQGIMRAYCRLTSREVQWTDRTIQHPTKPWMAGSPDALLYGASGRVVRGVDSKLVFFDQRRKWGETAHEIPEAYQLQAWWLMAITDCDVWDVAAWMGEDAPRIYEIERNREAERVVIERCDEWHRRYVLGDEMPPITGSQASARWLQQAFPTHKRPDMRQATAEEVDLLEAYAQARLLREDATEACEEMQNEIKLAIGGGEGLEWPGGKFTWRKTVDGVRVNWESLARGLLHDKDPELQETLLGIHTEPKPGERRMRFTSYTRHLKDDAA